MQSFANPSLCRPSERKTVKGLNLNNVFSKNNYNANFVRRKTHRNADSNVNFGPVTTATIPYISVTAETIARTLPPYNIRVAHKPIG